MSNKGILDIRHLASDDTCLMRSLLNLFGDAFEDIEIYCSAQPSGEYLRSLLAKDYFIVLVALKDEEVVGG
ncbi:MAG: AAC(3)-I family aminoglycoside 3-N-acetyltransferase, partial [Candidatus Dadabacteria bacterium]|nr:AAC(3)-I family aminoglycoside 3-N-acetyltransferase [Candidatus Dadabacteria bacterium]NIS09942.1 AAC(3)-I family aminoglycoside 3-N-acetyltransferase [Candidatus Dadabacteria bacterium]NIV41858.1 AAC(3)-I family aminoglycoside 3-N-acetyltransferase [Candidatus Dadabacteria bacterium]NIY22917.1 AAC(3)-I family aminoglycoside 3-N-acetyltransferase [Candidatus Dadabacteria bacterium]